MADGKGPKSPDELSKAFEQAFQQPPQPKEAAPQAAPVEARPKPATKSEEVAAQDNRAIEVTKEVIERLPSQMAQAVTAPVREVTEQVRQFSRPDNAVVTLAEMVNSAKNLADLQEAKNEASWAHEDAHQDLSAKEGGEQ